jgi:hypothetical protein
MALDQPMKHPTMSWRMLLLCLVTWMVVLGAIMYFIRWGM